MKLNDWLSHLEQLHFKAIDMGLDRIKPVAQALGLLQNNPFIITVAGTNGKGSTIAVMEALLLEHGHSVGVYTSPHLIDFNERIRLNRMDCDDETIVAALQAVDQARGDTSLTYFEFTTLAALYIFKQQKLDVWLLEVGLGGRLDAVNICDPDIAVVTSIDLDHQQWLGDSRANIGIEKIGIGRAGKPLVVGEPNLPEEVIAAIEQQGTKLYWINHHYEVDHTPSQLTFSIHSGDAAQSSFEFECQPHSLISSNIATALQALQLSPFQINGKLLQTALNKVRITGRQQWLNTEIPIVLDVGHNPHAAAALCQTLQNYRDQQTSNARLTIHCVVAMLSDKAVEETLIELLPVVDRWYPAEISGPRALPAKAMAQQLTEMGAWVDAIGRGAASTLNHLYDHLQPSCYKNDLILVFGSFYTVADVIQYCPLVTTQTDNNR